jgi:hypothetical protein
MNHRLKLYENFIGLRYWPFAMGGGKKVLWDRTVADDRVIHIHGDLDDVFPMRCVTDCIVVKGGTHIMILNKYRWLNANLPGLIWIMSKLRTDF